MELPVSVVYSMILCPLQVLTKVTWYTERVVSNISLGSVIVMMLVRTVQVNMAQIRVRGSYVWAA